MDIAGRIRQLLQSRALNIHQVSLATQTLYGSLSPFFIPHNFYHNLNSHKVSPHICQVFSLSRITGYNFVDWLSVFGFSLDEIPRLQVALHSDRTVLIPPVTYSKEKLVPWFGHIQTAVPVNDTIPCGRVIKDLQPRPVRCIERFRQRPFLYAKIGRLDTMAFPELAPNSIVRVDPRRTAPSGPAEPPGKKRPIYLVDHIHGLTCSYVDVLDKQRILLRSHFLPFESMELRLSKEAVILGTVDAEARSLVPGTPPEPSRLQKTARNPRFAKHTGRWGSSHTLLQSSRERVGMNFRTASQMSLRIAQELGDLNYSVSIASLSRYETASLPPRHIHKIISLCILYCMDFWDCMRAMGLPIGEAGKQPIPSTVSSSPPTQEPVSACGVPSADNGFMEQLIEQVEDFPLFLYEGFCDMLQSPGLSLRDVYWLGRGQTAFHPILQDGIVLFVNRRIKKVASSGWKHIWQRPLYLLLARGGKYICGFCSQQNGALIVHPHPDVNLGAKQFRYEQDAEVIGQVTGVIRLVR